VAGVHFLSPTNDPQGDRDTLRRTLTSMGCEINDTSAWMGAGDFESCIQFSGVTTGSAFNAVQITQKSATSASTGAILRPPADFDKLTPEDIALVQEILKGIDDWFDAGHNRYHVNTNEDRTTPRKVWKEVVKVAGQAGWDAGLRGAIVTIKKP
jgi:hypothetical protein